MPTSPWQVLALLGVHALAFTARAQNRPLRIEDFGTVSAPTCPLEGSRHCEGVSIAQLKQVRQRVNLSSAEREEDSLQPASDSVRWEHAHRVLLQLFPQQRGSLSVAARACAPMLLFGFAVLTAVLGFPGFGGDPPGCSSSQAQGAAGPDAAQREKTAATIIERLAVLPTEWPRGVTPPFKVKASSDLVRQVPAQHLCPSLVVPQNHECFLLLPRLQFAGSRGHEAAVDDLDGKPVFRTRCWEDKEGQTLSLLREGEEPMFGLCRQAASSAGGELTVLKGNAEHFGLLRTAAAEAGRSNSRYTFSTEQGWQVKLWGDGHLGGLFATDEQNEMMAHVGPQQEKQQQRLVRVCSEVDVGLMVLLLMGIDLLEHRVVDVN